jgi:hypothetical protein
MRRYIPPPRPPKNSHTHYFDLLSAEDKAKSVKRLSASHLGDPEIAQLTGLSVEQVRRLIGAP